MPTSPLRTQVHVDVPLTNVSIAYTQGEDSYVADEMFPIVPVNKRSDLFFKYKKEDFLRIEARERAPGTESAGAGYNLTTGSYKAKRFSLHRDIDDETRENADQPIDMDRDATIYVTQNLLMQRDSSFAASYLKTGVWGADKHGGVDFTAWTSGAGTPIETVRGYARSVIQTNTGKRMNRALMNRDVYDTLIDHPEFVDRIKYTTPATPEAILAVMGALFSVEKLLVTDAVQNTAAENATFSGAFIGGLGQMLLAHVAPNPSLLEPSAGYIFSWSKFDRVKKGGAAMKRIRIEEIESDRIEGDMYYDMNVVASDCGCYLYGAV